MSRYQLFAFVEGDEADPFFFGGVCRRACATLGVEYRVRLARELPYESGGKEALIRFYRYAGSRAKLSSVLGGKKTVLVFFLDKDVDDIRRTMCRSPHVLYTAYYDVQNHIFKESDFIRGVACAASIDPVELGEHPLFGGEWRQSAARRWKEWIALCLLAVKHKVPGPNYRVTSRVNVPLHGPVDVTRYQTAIEAARQHLGWTINQTHQTLGKLERAVNKHLADETFDCIFKGKWYATILESDLRSAFVDRRYHFDGLSKRVVATLGSTLDFSQPWADYFVRPLSALLDRCG